MSNFDTNLKEIRKKHYDATHNCYAYIIKDNDQTLIKSSDDGEPGGTAGVVIYEVLKKNNLTNIICIVTRYFGGIKLGAGGLVRAYSQSTAEAIKQISNLVKIEEKTKTQLLCAEGVKENDKEIYCKYYGNAHGLKMAIEIINQVAEEYNNGWIPVETRFPEDDKYVLLSFSNFTLPMIGRYEEDEEGGAFYLGDEDETCVSQDLFVNAWMPLPEPPKEE